jgi:porin
LLRESHSDPGPAAGEAVLRRPAVLCDRKTVHDAGMLGPFIRAAQDDRRPLPGHGGGWALLAFLWLIAGLAAEPAWADDAEDRLAGIPSASIASSLPYQGDPGGIRKALSGHGINYGLVYDGEVLANVAGGIRRGTIYEDLAETYVAVDFAKLIGWKGLSFYSNQFWIHGTGNLKGDFVGNLITISNIEALPTNRLSEIWLQQKLFNDTFSVRFGQLTTDSEFFTSKYFTLFITSDWPAITAENLPSGGPAYPLSTPGVRVKIEPTKDLALLVAVFNGDPAGPGPGDPQVKNRHGLNFRLRDPPLLISEVQYAYNQDKESTGLAGMIRLGGWHHFGRFDDQRFDIQGLSLANPLSDGIAARLRGNDGVYGVIDQQIWRPPGGDANSGVGLFSRISASPSDRNLINFYIDGGITFAGMVPGRPADKFGASFLYANISDRARALDRDRILFTGLPQPIRDYELSLELTYQAEIRPGWTVQPNFQYVFHPGGHVPDPALPSAAIPNAAIFGVRTTITY